MRRRADTGKILGLTLLGVLILGGVITGLTLSWPIISGGSSTSYDNDTTVADEDPMDEPEEPEPLPVEIDFQPVIDSWVTTVGGTKSVLIYDLKLDKVVGEYNISEDYNTASLYKLFVVYEGYKRVNTDEWDGKAKAGSTGYTINKCLDLAIRESYSPCAETLWSLIGHDALDTIIETEWEIVDSDISKLTSNVSDITKIMQRFYVHPDFDNPELLTAMWDSFLNQPATTYDWRQGLPSGFTEASVYNKVGWDYNPDGKYWNIYHDTAIVKFPLSDGTTRDFVVTVMTNKVDYKYIKNFGKMLETYFKETQN